jgi:hypothetical protein
MACNGQIFASDETKDSLTIHANRRANKAALMSAVIPGLGQTINKKYWKLPILYGGSAALIYFIDANNKEYKNFKKALVYRNDNESLTLDNYPRFTNEDLTVRKDFYRRNRDLSIILAGVLYTLNILDAYVDAQLLNFDVGDNLSLHTGGTIEYGYGSVPVPALAFYISFK